MSWNDRLQKASYEINGIELFFEYENVSTSFDAKGTAFNFPNGVATYVQRVSSTSHTYPLNCFFHGENYDLEADTFMKLLRVSGIGKLRHPMYGTVNVIPLGSINRKDDLKSGAGFAVISLSFLQTSGIIFPSDQENPEANVRSSLNRYKRLAGDQYASVIQTNTATEKVKFIDDYNLNLNGTYNGLLPLVESSQNTRNAFNTVYDQISLNLPSLLSDLDTLAAQTLYLISLPSAVPTDILSHLSQYNNLILLILSQTPSDKNNFNNNVLFAQGLIAGLTQSVAATEFETQPAAINTAVFVLGLFDLVNEWLDTNLNNFDQIDDGGVYEALQEAVAITAGYLVEISFTLKQEYVITLTAPRALAELVYELYGEVDEQYDFFINSNNLTGNEILEIPAGRVIRYYK